MEITIYLTDEQVADIARYRELCKAEHRRILTNNEEWELERLARELKRSLLVDVLGAASLKFPTN